MISVSDILVRGAVSQTGAEGPNAAVSLTIGGSASPATSVTDGTSATYGASVTGGAHGAHGEHGEYRKYGEYEEHRELLSFITRFAELESPSVLRESPVEDKLPAEGELTPLIHSSHDSVSPPLESEIMAWSIEDDTALYVLFDPARNGMGLPLNGQSLPDDAAIVAALLDVPRAAVQSEPARPLDSMAAQTAELQTHHNEAAVSVPGQAFIAQHVEMAARTDTLANTAASSSPVLAGAAVADEGVSADRTLAAPAPAPASGALPGMLKPLAGMVAEPLASAAEPLTGTQTDAPQQILAKQILAKIVGSSSSADAGGAGQEGHPRDSRMLVPPLLTPAREPAPAQSPASPTATDQASTMDFLLRNEGHDRKWGRERWAEGLGRQLMIMTRDGLSSARLRLDPPSLGMLSIQIQMTEQGASVSFVTQHPAVRDALEQQANRLQELFQDQELDLLDVSVSDHDAHERGEMNHLPEREASDEVVAEEQVVETHSHHLIDERV